MKKKRSQLDAIKNFIDSTYNSFSNKLFVNTSGVYHPIKRPELGYCYKFENSNRDVIYRIVCNKIGIEETDYRILLHEYGHIYLGHMDGIHEELDSRILGIIRDNRGELIDRVNKECGIDFAEQLIERIIDDPALNHSLHNIAMDMEVNSKVLSAPDIDEVEKDISSVISDAEEEILKGYKNSTNDEDLKKKIDEKLDKLRAESKIKLILPERYHISENVPFPNDLSYPGYLMLIVKHLDQFIKMLVSIKNGGNGDTSNISDEDVKEALRGMCGNCGGGDIDVSGENSNGDGVNIEGLDSLMEQLGLTDPSDSGNDGGSGSGEKGEGGKYKGTRDSTDDSGNDKDGDSKGGKDHGSDSREEADRKRELGEIVAKGGPGCSSTGNPYATRKVTKQDPIDMGLEEVIVNFKSRVLKVETKKDNLYSYNRGINRTVIAPSIRRKAMISTEPTIVFLIDISGSMDTRLVDRILNTIANKMRKINRGLKYNIISWSTHLGEHIQNIDPKKGVPTISMGGGTRLSGGFKYFRENYNQDAILILISDFEDYLEEWHNEEKSMAAYTMFGFNYGRDKCSQKFKYFKVKECHQ